MEKINVIDARQGMVLARPVDVFGVEGIERLPEGMMLDKSHISNLRKWGVEFLYVETYFEEDAGDEIFSASILMLGRQAYEDAVAALTNLLKAFASGSPGELHTIKRILSQFLDVVAIEHDLFPLLSRVKQPGEYFCRHCVDVCATAMTIGRYLDLEPQPLQALGIAALFHDIGLIRYKQEFWDDSLLTAVPDTIRSHPQIGVEMIRKIYQLEDRLLQSILQHHEFLDGSGYPHGTPGNEISPLGSILAISEAYNTLIAPLSPDKAMEPHQAVATILDPAYNRFHRNVMRAFIANISLYPVGAMVQLNNGANGVVVSTNPDKPLRPRLLMVIDEKGRFVRPFFANLTEETYTNWFIEKAIPISTLGKPLDRIIRL